MSNIQKYDNNTKLRYLPQSDYEAISYAFIEWLDKLLSLKGEDAAKRLEILIPVIKESAASFSKNQLHEAFVLYAKGDLDIDPKDNYLTVIQFNKVLKSYRRYCQKRALTEKKPQPEKPKPSVAEQEAMIREAVKEAFIEYKLTGEIGLGKTYLYGILYKMGLLPTDNETKNKVYEQAVEAVRIKKLSKGDTVTIKELTERVLHKSAIIAECHRISIANYFKSVDDLTQINL